MANITVTNTFTNGTAADATQVNTNFTDIINGTSDGTKDFSIAALTVGGTLTANGNVTLGNSSADDITITGSLAASIPVKTTGTYNLGAATLGWLSLYLGNASNSNTVRVNTGTTSASWTLTLPTAVSAAGQEARFSSAGVMSFTYGVVRAVTTTDSPTVSDEILLCDATAGAFTVTLPAVSGLSGKRYKIKKTDSSTNAVTVDGNGSETVDGAANYKLYMQNECIEIVTTGSTGWSIVSAVGAAGTYTPTLTNTTNIAASTLNAAFFSRTGNQVTVNVQVQIDPTSSGVGTTLTMTLPVATANFSSTSQATGVGASSGTTGNVGRVLSDSGAQTARFTWDPASAAPLTYSIVFTYQIQ